jgi:vacuolar-type H+-ATPase subunit H
VIFQTVTSPVPRPEEARLRVKVSTIILIACLATISSIAHAQRPTPIATLALGPDQIGVVNTAVGITTRITFPEPVQEIICGDLYDAATGKGTFVVQRSGTDQKPGNDVFIKPVASKGLSNMFVKAGEGKHTYNFDLKIVSVDQAHRVVNVTDAPAGQTAQPRDNQSTTPGGLMSSAPSTIQPATNSEQHLAEPDRSERADKPNSDLERQRADAEQQARQKADDIIRTAQKEANRIIGEAEAKLLDANRNSSARADQLSEQRFMQALMLGLREAKLTNSRATTKKKITVMLDPRMLMFDDKAYLRYTIQNAGPEDFTFTSVSLETGEATEMRAITVEVNQSKAENKLTSGESLTGVIAFDPKQITSKDRLTLFVRGEDSSEIAHVTIQ